MEVEPANWQPLETRIGSRCAEFMWMWRENGVEYYKHVATRRYPDEIDLARVEKLWFLDLVSAGRIGAV